MKKYLSQKNIKWAFIIVTALVMIKIYAENDRWFPAQEYFQNISEPRTRNDDAAYYFIGETFLGLPHDGRLVRLHPEYEKLMDAYPMRGVGLGLIAVSLHRAFNDSWRSVYIQLIIWVNVVGIFVLALGFAAFTGSKTYFTAFYALLIDKFSLFITDPTSYCTEAFTRGIIPLLFGLGFLVLHSQKSRRTFWLLASLMVLTGVYLIQIKVQFLLGVILATGVLLLARKTWKLALLYAVIGISAIVIIRGIHYFTYNGNKEIFQGVGLLVLRWSPVGPEVLDIGCKEGKFPPRVAANVCGAGVGNITANILGADAPIEEKAKFLEEAAVISRGLYLRDLPTYIKPFMKFNVMVLRNLYFTLEAVTTKKLIKITGLLFLFFVSLFFIGWSRTVELGAVAAFLFGSLFLPNLTITNAGWEYRYMVPLKSFFYTIPILGILAALFLNKDFIWKKIKPFYDKGLILARSKFNKAS